MNAIHFKTLVRIGSLFLCWFVGAMSALSAPPQQAIVLPATSLTCVRSPREFLTSPRETLKTLYFAVVAYDLRPQLIEEAIACLDLDPVQAVDAAEAARLAIDLEQVLRTLCIPVHSVPDNTDLSRAVAFDAEGFKISLARSVDGLWRFDRDTVSRIPAMSRMSLARFRDGQAERARLKDEYTDPSATMRRFLMDSITKDFYSAARCLDLSSLTNEERSDKGPLLARQLAFVLQRRGWLFLQEVPNQPNGPPFTWHADRYGRIVLERVRLADGKEAWLFSKKTVRNIAAMYEQVKDRPADPRYVYLGVALAPTNNDSPCQRRPDSVPAQLGSPRALLKNFFRVMDEAETKDAELAESTQFFDLDASPPEDRKVQGTKIASKLDAVLRKTHVELSALPDDWNAPMQVLGEDQGIRIEIVRQRDGSWCFSQNTVNQTPAYFDKLVAKDKNERSQGARPANARDAMSTFLNCIRRGDYEQAADCLDLSDFRRGTRDDVGPVLAYKLKFIMDRISRVYIQEVPDAADGPCYDFYRGELGRIVIDRRTDDPRKGSWLFTPDTVDLVEKMFRTVVHQPAAEAGMDTLPRPDFWSTPGLWVRIRVPNALRAVVWHLQIYQWLGLGVSVLVSVLTSRLLLARVNRLIAWILHACGSVLSKEFVAAKLRPLTWVSAWWMMFQMLKLLDLPVHIVDIIQPFKTFGMAGLIGWLGVHIVDLATNVYMNSELIRPHRSLSDMIVPVSMRTLKAIILLLVTIYMVYQVGQGDLLNRFLTGLGVAGLAASLAAQDALKSFFSTLLLIGERSFRIGDKIKINDLEGMVEQVGFRATRLRMDDGSVLTVPNSDIASAPISNLSTRSKREAA